MGTFMPRVLITGASSGIGLAIAEQLYKEGFHLLLVARDFNKLSCIQKQLKNHTEIYALDLMNQTALQEFLIKLYHLGALPDIVVHNVGGRLSKDVQPLSSEAFLESMEFNLGIAVRINAFLLPIYAQNKKGYILHISSDSALNGDGAPGYVASKAALNAYIKSTARFYAKDNICINGVMPGIVEFDGGVWAKKRLLEPQAYQKALANQPLQRFGTLDEIAQFVVLLIQASNLQTTGQIYVLNGGK